MLQQGSVEVSGVERKAIQISQSLKGKILCRVNGTDPTNGSSSRLEPIGDSVYSYRKIILADTLPGVNQTTNEGGCS